MKIAAYNPQVANCVGRWKLILLQFAALQVIGFSGTKQVFGGQPTYYSWTNRTSVIDYVGCPTTLLPAALKCETWKATGYRLQLCRRPCLRDHVPVVATLDFQNQRSVTRYCTKWDHDKLQRPDLFTQESYTFLSNFDKWVEDNDVEEQLKTFGDHLQVDKAWDLVFSGAAHAAEVYYQSKQAYKYPPSNQTQQLRETVLECWEQRRLAANTLNFDNACNRSLSSILWSRLWTVKQNKADAQLASARRRDRIWWREFWTSNLQAALNNRHYRRAWFLARKIAGTGCIKKRRFFVDVPANSPNLEDWITSVCSSGPSGGLQAQLIATETCDNNTVLPFADHLSRLAVEYPLDVFSSFRGNSSFILSLRGNSSFGGGRGSLHNVSGSVLMCILRERRLNLATNDWINHADNDLRCLKRGLAHGKSGRSVPCWSLPKEVWKTLLLCKQQSSKYAKRVLWLLFRCFRLALQCPIKWKPIWRHLLSLINSLDVFRVVMRGSTFLTGLIVLPVFACADKGDYTASEVVLSP